MPRGWPTRRPADDDRPDRHVPDSRSGRFVHLSPTDIAAHCGFRIRKGQQKMHRGIVSRFATAVIGPAAKLTARAGYADQLDRVDRASPQPDGIRYDNCSLINEGKPTFNFSGELDYSRCPRKRRPSSMRTRIRCYQGTSISKKVGRCKKLGLLVLATFLLNPGVAIGIEQLDATRVRLLPGSPFYDRRELHRRGSTGVTRTR